MWFFINMFFIICLLGYVISSNFIRTKNVDLRKGGALGAPLSTPLDIDFISARLPLKGSILKEVQNWTYKVV